MACGTDFPLIVVIPSLLLTDFQREVISWNTMYSMKYEITMVCKNNINCKADVQMNFEKRMMKQYVLTHCKDENLNL